MVGNKWIFLLQVNTIHIQPDPLLSPDKRKWNKFRTWYIYIYIYIYVWEKTYMDGEEIWTIFEDSIFVH